MISAARCPAFRAPIGPTATVATGMPGGICTIERSEFEPRQRCRRERNADHGDRGERCEHARQVGGRPGAGHEHPEPPLVCRERVRADDVTGAVRRHDADLPADPVLGQDVTAGAHDGEIGLTADHDADTDGGGHDDAATVTGSPMSLRACIPSKCTRARFAYARSRAASVSRAIAVTQRTRPPAVRSAPPGSRAVPAWKQSTPSSSESIPVTISPRRTSPG